MKSLICLLFLCGTIANIVSAEQDVRFDNYKVYNVFMTTDEELKQFHNLRNAFDINVMKEGSDFGIPYYLTVDSKNQLAFEKGLGDLKIKFELIDNDFQKTLDGRTLVEEKFRNVEELEWTKYHHLSTINAWIHKIARENYFIKKYIIGFTVQLKPIYALKISKNRNKKAIFIESSIHAIEWISSAVSTCFLDKLLTTHSELLEEFDWIFVPILNPDGFHYTHTKSPLWRKNRSWSGHYNSSGLCYGTDLNRNFNHNWGESGYNVKDPCDHFYGGNTFESERETKALKRFVESFPKDYIRMYLALHSYGQLVLLPYGDVAGQLPSNYAEMLEISAAFTDAAEAKHGVNYLYGTSEELLGAVAGPTKDYFYSYGIPYTATVELRDRGRYGFFLPAAQIIPTCEEFTDGIVAMVNAADRVNLFD